MFFPFVQFDWRTGPLVFTHPCAMRPTGLLKHEDHSEGVRAVKVCGHPRGEKQGRLLQPHGWLRALVATSSEPPTAGPALFDMACSTKAM
eukprot:9255094-Lingulodinium_polyedra.AAC.1